MKLKQLFVVLLCLFSLNTYAAPEKIFHDTDGHVIKLSDLKGKWIIINYWASWCTSCMKEVPDLNRFYLDNKNQSVLLYGYDNDQLSERHIKEAVVLSHIAYPVLIEDPTEALGLSANDIAVLPTTFIINPQGKVVKKIVGVSKNNPLPSIINTFIS